MVSETVGNIVSNCLDIEPEHVTPTANLANDLGMDSLSWQELLITLEERFAIQISDEIAGTLVTVQELIERVVLIIQAKNKQSLQLQL
ncbi:acyl carrier protein [Pleurocapsa sp. CCALA 161]|nr:acyl carrier protein [Pleurocapsa sp. CCALA 161]